jgi:hypothetical protein
VLFSVGGYAYVDEVVKQVAWFVGGAIVGLIGLALLLYGVGPRRNSSEVDDRQDPTDHLG